MNKLTTYEAAWLIGGADFLARIAATRAVKDLEAAVRAKGQLRDMFEHPLPGMPKIDPFKPVRDNTIDGTLGPSTGSGYL
jgi:hypothetical protein